ncbi:MAG TPA: transposase [Thermoanaerobaculia bacterium]|nr:transposase [Thermoanaerobaculia bacterium]
MRKARRTFTADFKREAVRLVLEKRHPLSEVARDLDLDPKMLCRWRDELAAGSGSAFPGKGHQQPEQEELHRLQREIERLRQEREILKKALAIFSAPTARLG